MVVVVVDVTSSEAATGMAVAIATGGVTGEAATGVGMEAGTGTMVAVAVDGMMTAGVGGVTTTGTTGGEAATDTTIAGGVGATMTDTIAVGTGMRLVVAADRLGLATAHMTAGQPPLDLTGGKTGGMPEPCSPVCS